MCFFNCQGEPLVDGIPVSKAFRHREKMLLQAVVEKYGEVIPSCLSNICIMKNVSSSIPHKKLRLYVPMRIKENYSILAHSFIDQF